MSSRDYQKALLEWVEPANLPDYLGGTSRATLLDDAGPWQDPGIVAEIEAQRARSGGAKHIREEPEGEGAGPGARLTSATYAVCHPSLPATCRREHTCKEPEVTGACLLRALSLPFLAHGVFPSASARSLRARCLDLVPSLPGVKYFTVK